MLNPNLINNIIAITVAITPKKNFAGNLLLSFLCFGIAFGTIV
jgi:hypothetical protein